MIWTTQVGEVLRRRAVHQLYGGQWQQGISTPANSAEILVFTDPIKGRKYGYDRFEGIREDGVFGYTGEGRVGTQSFTGGNRAILNSPANGKTIRLFRTEKTLATYVGAFTLDDPPFEMRDIPDETGATREGIVFRLAPVDADTRLLPTAGREHVVKLESSEWAPPLFGSYNVAQVSRGDQVALRVEFELQAAFGSWRRAQGSDLRRLRIPVGTNFVEPDLFDASTSELFEAKKSSARKYVRTAIGQVLDYTHNARLTGLQATPALLLPSRPEQDLVDLCRSLSIKVYAPHNAGFSDLTLKT